MTYQKTTGEFRSSDDKHIIRYYIYTSVSGDIKAILQISHGMCEYIGRYEDFASFLCENGILVCGNDHLGHGSAALESGSLGYFAKKDGWRFLPADVRKLTILMKKRYPDIPYFLLGHSMGSFVARIYLEKYGELLDGAILMGTSGKNPLASLGIRLAERTIRTRGEKYQSEFLTRQSTGNYNKRFREEKDDQSWLTKDEAIRKQYAADPLCNFRFTASAHRDLFTLLREVSREEWAHRIPKNLPILLTSGDKDPVGNYGKGVKEVYERLQRAGVRDVTLKLYKDDRHEILNETDRDTVYRDILDFINSKSVK